MLTTQDWIARAHAGEDAAAALVEAARVARFGSDWVDVAVAWLDRDDREAARRCLSAAVEHAGGDHWACRTAAALMIERLDDRDGALACLARIEARLAAPDRDRTPPAYEWVMLADAYRVLVAQPDDARRCLTIAAGEAREAKDLADLAGGYADVLGDLDATRALLERAEHQARNGGELRDLWGVANRWLHQLHDPARARAALAAATAETSSVETLTALAIAWRSLFDDAEALRGALVRGESLATDSAAWLSLAEGWHDGGADNREAAWDPAGVRRCLERARACNAPALADIAAGYLTWLGDAVAAAEVAPVGRAPEELAVRARTLDGWDGSGPRALLHHLRARITAEAIAMIARADYGMAWVKHHRAVQAIVDTGLQPIPLPWHPLEVLALVRWRRGADVDHVARALACTVLAFDSALPDCQRGEGLGDVIAPLVESAWALGLDDELVRQLIWVAEVTPHDEAWPILGLVLHRARSAPDDPRLAPLIEHLERDEERATPVKPAAGWLFRTTHFDQSKDLWRALAAEALPPDRALPPHLVRLAARLRGAPVDAPGAGNPGQG